VHSSSIVELPDGRLFAVYYRGSGERRADDVRLEGALLARGGREWSSPFQVAETPGFPDCNPVTFLDGLGRLVVAWRPSRTRGRACRCWRFAAARG